MFCVEWLWENGPSALVTVGPSALGAVGPSALRGAKHRGMYLRHELQINTLELVYEKWRQFLDFERSEKGIFWETQKSTLLENPFSKGFTKVENLKFCRHFCLHRIHGLILIWMFLYRPMEGMFLLFYAERVLLAPRILQIKTFIDWFVIE